MFLALFLSKAVTFGKLIVFLSSGKGKGQPNGPTQQLPTCNLITETE
jgi:hypothetical protein